MKKNARLKIFKSTITLMEEYALEEITIKMICAYSGINRSTFYVYFIDKYDLFDQIQNYHMKHYQQLLEYMYLHFDDIRHDNQKLLQFFRIIFTYIKRYKRFFHAIFVSHPQRTYVLELVRLTYNSYEKMLRDYTKLEQQIYFAQYLIGGQLGVVHAWLRRDCLESPEEMAQTMLVNTIKMRA